MSHPQLHILLVITAIAVVTDIRSHKIPNILCLIGITGGLFYHFQVNSFAGLFADGFGGMISAGLILLPLYIMGGMAAGDVKLMAAVGCILGWPLSIEAALYSLISGSCLGIAYYIFKGGFKEIAFRYSTALKYLVFTGKIFLPEAPAESVSRSRFPYAAAIFSGSVIAYSYGLGA